jgi:hypothetical protein
VRGGHQHVGRAVTDLDRAGHHGAVGLVEVEVDERVAEHVPDARVAVSDGGHLVTPEQRIAEMVDLIRS